MAASTGASHRDVTVTASWFSQHHVSIRLPGTFRGTGSLTQQGTGTVILTGNNSYQGGHTSAPVRCSSETEVSVA